MTCQVDGCDRSAVLNAKGLRVCRTHWERNHKNGSFGSKPIQVQRKRRGECVVEGCDKTDQGKSGYCNMHATRIRRHGDPHVRIDQADRSLPKRSKNHNWTGDDVTYTGVHQRLAYWRGKAADHVCVDCHLPAKQWSYDRMGGDRERLDDFGPYSISVDDYSPRCVKCHKAFDLAAIRGAR